MQIVTIAVVASLNQKSDGTFWCDPVYAPIWKAGRTNYLVSSGPSDEPLETSDPITAKSDRVNIVVGMDGLSALSAMGLTPKITSDSEA